MHKTESFFWSLFCDNYLEITKTRTYDEENNNPEGALSARLTLYHGLKTLLQLFAPFMPHITEEIYQILYSDESIHKRGNWPKLDVEFASVKLSESENLLTILELVRKIKAQDNLSIKAPIEYIEVQGENLSDDLISDLKHVTSSAEIRVVDALSSDAQGLSENDISINVVYEKG
jgi:valyl-tRNA synthetase